MSPIRAFVVVALLAAANQLAAQSAAAPPARGLARAELPTLPLGMCAPDWEAAFGASPGVDDPNYLPGVVIAAEVFDDGLGDGPVLFVGGRFTSAGGVPAAYLARWDGSEWSALGAGVQFDVLAMAVWNDGSGDALYIGGDFSFAGGAPANRLCKWDGSGFSPLGSGANDRVLALGTWTTMSGTVLVVGGEFTLAGGVAAKRVATWNGSVFAQVGDGLNGDVYAVAQYGTQLVAGGGFTHNGPGLTPLPRLAASSGGAFTTLGGGANGLVRVLEVLDLGGGPQLYVGGDFTSVSSPALPSSRVAAWDGLAWSTFTPSLLTPVTAIAAWDDGGGKELYVASPSLLTLPNNHVVRWTGSSWAPLGVGPDGSCITLAVHDDGSGEKLWALGQFETAAGLPSNSVASWDGSVWAPTGSGFQYWINALCASTVGGGPGLFIGGYFNAPGVPGQRHLAWWKDGVHQPLGSANAQVRAILEFDDGSGPALYFGGDFTSIDGLPANYIARWDGSTWSALGTGFDNAVRALGVFDDGSGPALYATGDFSNAGGAPASRIARWDGAAWSPLGAGLVAGSGRALQAWDDGSGPALYIAGSMNTSFGAPANGIVRWDGASFSPLGAGLSGAGQCLALFDDGTGQRLHVGGTFSSASGVLGTSNIAAWDGTSWASLDGGLAHTAFALAVHDDGGGPALFAGGYFPSAGPGFSVPANHVARWDGVAWSALGAGVDHGVFALETIDDGSGAGPRLAVGGSFAVVPDTVPTAPASHLALWGGCWSAVNAWTDLGFALPGTAGNPVLVGTGSLALDSINDVDLSNANPSATAALFLSFTSTPTAFVGGTLVPVPYYSLIMAVTDPLGAIPLSFVQPSGVPSGTTLFLQWAISDVGAVSGVALSNALRGDVP